MNVYILEDHEIEQHYLVQTLHRIQSSLGIASMTIKSFLTVEPLMAQLPTPGTNNVFLLDLEIDGNKKAGLQVSQQIRQHDAFATIIFITVHDEFLPTTYKFKSEALDFIAKDQDDVEAQLTEDLKIVVKKNRQHPAQRLIFKTTAGYLNKALDDIRYFEPSPTNSHQSLLHTTDNQVITINATLNELEQKFPIFYRAHRHYLINPLKVTSINLRYHTLRFQDANQEYPFSRLRTKALLARLKEHKHSVKII